MSAPVPWFPIHPHRRMFPGAPITVLKPDEPANHIDLFVSGADGTVWSTFYDDIAQWRPWFPIHPEFRVHPGAKITALHPTSTHIDLFAVADDGAVWSTFHEHGQDWVEWFPIRPGVRMAAGATVTALKPDEAAGHIDLFVTAADGAVWSTFFDNIDGWRDWFPIHPEVRMLPGATVTAVQAPEDPYADEKRGHIDLFVTAADGTVWSTFHEYRESWRDWFPVGGDLKVCPGTTVTAPYTAPGSVYIVASGTDGTIWATFHHYGSDWRPWAPVHPEREMKRGAEAAIPSITWRSNADGYWSPIFVVNAQGDVWSSIYDFPASYGDPDVAWQTYWTAWSAVNPLQRVAAPGATPSLIELGEPRDDGFWIHTNIFVTGADGIVWSSFWRSDQMSRAFVPDIPQNRPGDPAEGPAAGPAGGRNDDDDPEEG